MKIKQIWLEDVRQTYVDQENFIKNYTFTITLKRGLFTEDYKFITNLPHFTIAYLSERGYCEAPTDKKENRKILILAYGALKKQLAEWELEYQFEEQDRKEKEKRLQEQREKELGIIKVGEQVTIEKYLKNK